MNADIVKAAKDESYISICSRLKHGFKDIIAIIEALNDEELLEVGTFDWTGKWPVSRWISINTARQYTTTRTYIRRARRKYLAENK